MAIIKLFFIFVFENNDLSIVADPVYCVRKNYRKKALLILNVIGNIKGK